MEKHVESIEKEYNFQRKDWTILRVGWLLMAVFLTLGLFGLFGSGTLSWQIRENDAVSIEYERFLRNSMVTKIRVTSKTPLSDSSIYINADYVKKVKIDRITPEPASMQFQDNQLRIRFNSPIEGPVVLFIQPYELGSQTLDIIAGGHHEKLNQFIHF